MQGKRSRLPIEKRRFYPFKGDWEALEEILAPTKVSVTEFLRELLHRQITIIRNRQEKRNVTIPLDDTSIIASLSGKSSAALQYEPSGDD